MGDRSGFCALISRLKRQNPLTQGEISADSSSSSISKFA